ncbi:MAG: LysR family transcriptional regulator [Caldimonas sp.]
MNVRNLDAFCAVAQHGSLTRAAAALGEAQSALSRRICALETELEARLFYRTGRGAVLTELGERLHPRARAVLAELTALAEEVHGERDSPRGHVEIGVVPGMSRPLVSRLCAELRASHPRIRLRALEAYSGQVEEWLASGRIGIGIFNRYGRGKVRDAELLLESEVALVLPRGRFRLPVGDLPLRALRDLPLVLPARPNALVARLTDLATRQGIELDIAFEAGSSALIRDAVANAGLGTLVPLHLATRDYAEPVFEVRRIVKPAIRQQTWLAFGSQRPVSAADRVVLRLLRTLAGQAP